MSIHVSLNRTDKPSTSTHHPTIRDTPFPASTIRLSIWPWNYFPRVKSLTQPVSQPRSPTSILRPRSLSPAPEQHVPISHTRPDAARTPPLPLPDVRLLCNQNSKTSFSLSIGSRPGAPSGGRARTPPNMNFSRVTDVKEVGMGEMRNFQLACLPWWLHQQAP